MEALSPDGNKNISNPKLQGAALSTLEKGLLLALDTQLLSITWKILSVVDSPVYYFLLKEFHSIEINAVQTTATIKTGSTLKAAI